jgi:hypothetical protein
VDSTRSAFKTATAAAQDQLKSALGAATTREERRAAWDAYRTAIEPAREAQRAATKSAADAFRASVEAARDALEAAIPSV